MRNPQQISANTHRTKLDWSHAKVMASHLDIISVEIQYQRKQPNCCRFLFHIVSTRFGRRGDAWNDDGKSRQEMET